jgi:hypothetical protein
MWWSNTKEIRGIDAGGPVDGHLMLIHNLAEASTVGLYRHARRWFFLIWAMAERERLLERVDSGLQQAILSPAAATLTGTLLVSCN